MYDVWRYLQKQIFDWLSHRQKFKSVGQNKYDKGSILDPQSDKTYRFSLTVSPDGEKLTARGYIGISAIGRNQTWYRVK